MQKPREERRHIQEPCMWCSVLEMRAKKGMILNESSSGILLQTDGSLKSGARVYVLPQNIGDFVYENATPLIIFQHPVTRSGTVVRVDEHGRAGVRFDSESHKPSQFNRWYRGNSTITGLIDENRTVLALSGHMPLEGGTLVQSLIEKAVSHRSELLIAAHEVSQFRPSALTMIRNAIRKGLEEGCLITLLIDIDAAPSAGLLNGLQHYDNLFSCQFSASRSNSSSPAVNQAPAQNNVSPAVPENMADAVIISQSHVGLSRYARPLEQANFSVVSCQMFDQGLKTILETAPQFVIVEFTIETCGELVRLNEIKRYHLFRYPVLLLIGPDPLRLLVKAAMKLPVSQYLPNPCTNKEYIAAIKSMLYSLPQEVKETHFPPKGEEAGQ